MPEQKTSGPVPAEVPTGPEKGLKTITMAELGDNLAVGIDGKDRALEFVEIFTEQELAIASILRQKSPNQARAATGILAYCLNRVGTRDFTGGTDKKKRQMGKKDLAAQVSGWCQGDVMTAWMRLRMQEIGSKLVFERVQCQKCGTLGRKVAGDLNQMDVRVPVRPGADISYEIDLEEVSERLGMTIPPIKIGSREFTKFRARPYTWMAVEGLLDPANMNPLNLMTIYHADVRPIEAEQLFISPQTKLRKRQIEALANEIAQHRPGPDVSMLITCDQCGWEWKEGIDWSYNDFFTTPSSST